MASRRSRTDYGLWWRAAVIVCAGLVAYSNSLSGPFVLDDQESIVENQQIRDLTQPGAVLFPERELPTAGRPLVNLSFAVNYAIGGLDPLGYHAVNIALHLMAGLLVFGIVRRTLAAREGTPDGALDGRALDLGFAAALLWTVHPLNTEAVNYLTQRTELMMGLCYLLTLYASIRRWPLVAVAACAAGMACKESMVTAPLMVILYDAVFVFASLKRALAARWRFYLALALTWTILAALLWSGPRIHSAGFSTGISPWTYLLNQCVMIAQYLRLSAWPRSMVLLYGWPLPLTLPDVLPQAIGIVVLLAVTVVALVRWPRWGFLGAWFFITLAPASSIIPIATEVGAERRMYIPLVALVVCAVCAVSAIRRAGALTAGVALGLVCTALAAGTLARNREYASGLTLAMTSVERHPTPLGHHALGVALLGAGAEHRDEAVAHLRQALPGAPRAHYALGIELYNEGKLEEAISELQALIREQPMVLDAVSAREYLSVAYARLKRWPDAIEQNRLVLTMNPSREQGSAAEIRLLEAERAFGDELFSKEAMDVAIPHYQTYLRARPDDVSVLTNLGVALASTNRLAEAVPVFRRAVALDPRSFKTQRNLATALVDAGDPAGAVEPATQALALQPGDRAARDLLNQARRRSQ